MVVDKKLEILEKSSVKLTVTVEKKDVREAYDKIIDKYCKTMQIKGFRKGKVPRSVLEHKYEDSLKSESSVDIIENTLKEVFEEIDKKPLSFCTPELDGSPELTIDKDFTFTVTYDTFPDIEQGNYKDIELTAPYVSVLKNDVDREIGILQEQNSVITDKLDGIIEIGSVVAINFSEIDEEGKDIEDTKREDFVFTVGTWYNSYKIDDDLLEMKNGEEKIIEKEYPKDFNVPDLAGTKKKLRVKVISVKEKQLPKLDDELAQDISDKYETLTDMKDDVKKKLKESADAKIKENNINNIMDKIIETSKIDLPQSMIDQQVESSLQNIISQSQVSEEQFFNLMTAQGKTKEDFKNELQPGAERSLKSKLLIENISDKEKIEISENEIEEAIKKQAESGIMSVAETKDIIEKRNLMEYIKADLKHNKLLDFLLKNAIITKGEKLKYIDLFEKNK